MKSSDHNNLKDFLEGIGNPADEERGETSWEWKYENLADLLDFIEERFLQTPNLYRGHFLNQKQIINNLNRLHFLDRELALVFRAGITGTNILVAGKPGPCLGSSLLCTWGRPEETIHQRREYRFLGLMIEDGRGMIVVKSSEFELGPEGIRINLPEKGYALVFRQDTRYRCPPLPVGIMQDGLECDGALVEFSGSTFAVEIKEPSEPPWKWINPQSPVNVLVKKESAIIYSGEGRIVKEKNAHQATIAIIRPVRHQIQRIRRQEIRSERLKLFPPPQIHFSHPIVDKMIKLPILDLSYSGFSVEEKHGNLMPGLIIPDLKMEFPDSSRITCRAQVIYQLPLHEEIRKCGIFILQISAEDLRRLSNLINQGLDQHIEVNGEVDFESLWKMFFESGFIYPEKYAYLLKNREHLREIYKRIYIQHPDIAQHFTYQDRGEIQGHVAMLRIFEKTWMVHHFAAKPELRHKRVGLILMYQLNRYINDCANLASAHLDYILSFFQPSNKFSNLIFGGAVRKIGNPTIVSYDSLAYMNFPGYIKTEPLPVPWTIEPASLEDLEQLSLFYKRFSGGMLLEALDMSPDLRPRDTLGAKYLEAGLKRERTLLAVKRDKRLKAVISILITDAGLNLSELTNAVLLLVLDQEDFPFEVFLKVLGYLGLHFPMEHMPIMVYPLEYAERQGLRYERLYNAWVLNLSYREYYTKYLRDVFSKIKLI